MRHQAYIDAMRAFASGLENTVVHALKEAGLDTRYTAVVGLNGDDPPETLRIVVGDEHETLHYCCKPGTATRAVARLVARLKS